MRWTSKSTSTLSGELFSQHGIRFSDKTVGKPLREHGYSLQAPNESVEGAQHPDRNARFERINDQSRDCIKRGISVSSVDTKNRSYETIISLIGNTTNRAGLAVRARLDRRRYPIGKKVSAKDLAPYRVCGSS